MFCNVNVSTALHARIKDFSGGRGSTPMQKKDILNFKIIYFLKIARFRKINLMERGG